MGEVQGYYQSTISDEDRKIVKELGVKWQKLIEDQEIAEAIRQDKEAYGNFLTKFGHVMKLSNRLFQELDDLGVIYSTTLEHSTDIENELSFKNEQITNIMEKMKKYLSNQLYDLITGGKLEASTLTHRRKQLTIFFSDIVGFTDITDSIEPEQLSAVLNSYLNEMAKIATKWGGTIDKYIGDAIMIFFGDREGIVDPSEEAKKCVLMALEMQANMQRLRGDWSKMGFNHRLDVRIGINTGFCTVGNFGSEERMDYTLIGGQVNVASRLEHQAPVGGILISGSTYQMVKEGFECHPRGSIQVKGVAHPIETFEVTALRESDATVSSLLRIDPNGFEIPNLSIDITRASNIEKEEVIRVLRKALSILETAVHPMK